MSRLSRYEDLAATTELVTPSRAIYESSHLERWPHNIEVSETQCSLHCNRNEPRAGPQAESGECDEATRSLFARVPLGMCGDFHTKLDSATRG